MKKKLQIDANDLLLFAKVADAGSFSKAAEQTLLPKSTVSRRITTLEEQVGERLFSRNTRKISLTEFGVGLLEYAYKLAADVDAAEHYAVSRHGMPSGKLRVSLPPDFHPGITMGNFVLGFMHQYPDIQLELDFSARYVDLIGEQFDLAIRATSEPLADDATIVAKPIATIQNALYASPEYVNTHSVIQHPDDLFMHTVLHLASSSRSNRLWNLKNGTQQWSGLTSGSLVCNSLSLIVQLVQEGKGLAFLSDGLVSESLKQGLLVRVLPDWQAPDTYVWGLLPSRRLIPARTTAFINALSEAFAISMANAQ